VLVVAINVSSGDVVVSGDVDDGRSPDERVWEPSAGDELDVPGSGALLVATGSDLDGKRTLLNPPAPK
jgi:hypothetical protein